MLEKPDSVIWEILLVESGIYEIFACGIRDPVFWNPFYSAKNPVSTLTFGV